MKATYERNTDAMFVFLKPRKFLKYKMTLVNTIIRMNFQIAYHLVSDRPRCLPDCS